MFDDRIGLRSLPRSVAVYTNLSDDPNPQPTGLASDLIGNRTRAVLIVDNCPPDLHRRLSELCSGQDSTVSVLTVEYDVRDDQPEGTQVVTLETSSPELIEKLVRRRYPHISPVDAGGIAEASGGNARIAIALAETVERSDSIAGLSNDELFQRLFRQRQDPNNALLLAAQACSLVYSFEGEALAGEEAELPRLASLADQTAQETYRLVGELLRRDLVQRRGVWRAVLPHAIANRLAGRALDDTPYDLIHQQLIEGGNERLARSFSRRLSFLHDHPRAVAIVKQWLAPDGLLGNVSGLNDLRRAMFVNVAPVLPEAALAALERDGGGYSNVDMFARRRLLSLLRSLAYDALLFERSAQLLSRAAMESADDQEAKAASDTFVSLFTIHLSGTHATIEQRLGVIEQHLKSGEAKARTLGLAALDKVLATNHFRSSDRFEFGARSRDFGYTPRTVFDVAHWYGAALTLIEGLALTEGVLKPELRDLLAQNFDGLWTEAGMHSELERLCRGFAADGFWREGWAACRHTMRFDREQQTSESASRLFDLEADLRPSNLPDRVRAMVLGNRSRGFDLECIDVDGSIETASERMEAIARELGAAVAADDEAFAELLPDLLRGGNRAWTFGRGLAAESPDRRATWAKLVEELEQTAPEQRNVHVLCGFMAELWEQDRHLAQTLLDSALDPPALLSCLPELHTAVKLDERGVERLKRALSAGQVPVRRYRNLAFGQTTDHLAGGVLRDLLLLIANQSDGLDVALEILSMRLFSDRSVGREYEPELLELGRMLLPRVTFRRHDHRGDHELAAIAKACFTAPDTALVAAELVRRIKQAVEANEISSLDNDDLLTALIGVQPVAVLDALFEGDEQEQQMGVYLFERLFDHRSNPADAISCDALIAWCEADRERRYPLAASVITFARRTEPDGPKVWSEQAKAIIASAPDPTNVLAVFVERFRPTTWTGSRAALIEANGRLLDSLESDAPPSLMPFLNEAKAQLAQLVARERERETKEDRGRDERFE